MKRYALGRGAGIARGRMGRALSGKPRGLRYGRSMGFALCYGQLIARSGITYFLEISLKYTIKYIVIKINSTKLKDAMPNASAWLRGLALGPEGFLVMV
jgi:hypothetical protein